MGLPRIDPANPSPIDDATEAYGAWADEVEGRGDGECSHAPEHDWQPIDGYVVCIHCGDVAE